LAAAVLRRAALSIAVLTCGCGRGAATGGAADAGATTQPEGWNDAVAIATPVDLNPDPHILEVNIEAAVTMREIVPGTLTPVWTYNGQIPGPTLRAAVGDRVIVHFTNHLPEATTIHWHGLRVDAAMDGTPAVQAPVLPEATFDYDFVVPDAGLFWYHPHIRSNAQVGDGLYGAIVVDDPTESPDLGQETVLVLSDVLVGPDGQFPAPDPNDALTGIWGREGTIILVNGKVAPVIRARRGLRQRWRLVNAATSRYFSIDFAGNSLTRIGGDQGLIERPITSNTMLLAPGQRADVLVAPDAPPGTRLAVRWLPYDRGYGTAFGRVPADIFYVDIADGPSGTAPAPLTVPLRVIDPVDTTNASEQNVTLSLVDNGYGINGEPFGSPAAKPLQGTVGKTDIWTVSNESDFDHPFHLHGFVFQVLENDTLEPRSPHEWMDTVNVPQWSDVTFAVSYDDRPGSWMFHCHILDHAELGMMGMLEVAR
jgi:FtsP/CotA-like multicopper oxidase with cupredoxin domain